MQWLKGRANQRGSKAAIYQWSEVDYHSPIKPSQHFPVRACLGPAAYNVVH